MQVIHGCNELAVPSFKDESKRWVWWRMVQDPKHIIQRRKGNEEVFRMEAVDCDVRAQNTVEVSEPEPDISGGDQRMGAAHHYDQCMLQCQLRSINFVRAVHHTGVKRRPARRIAHRRGLRQ
jgi:hypothetical protein